MKARVYDWAPTRRKSSPSSTTYSVYSDVAMVVSQLSFGDIKPPNHYYAIYRICLTTINQYLTTIKVQLIRGFPQARLADVINCTPQQAQGLANYINFLQIRPLFKHDTEDGRRHFFHWSCILYVQERINEIRGSRMCACLTCITYFYLCLRSVFDQTDPAPPPHFALVQQ
jgi:hypothetical protein